MHRSAKRPVFGLLANTSNAKAVGIAREILKRYRADIIVEKATATALGVDGVPLNQLKADILITIGGDGTVLRALQHNNSKILGVNAGVLGFLTEASPDDYAKCIERAFNGDYTVESRIKLGTALNSKRLFDCTNEAVLHTAQIAKMMHFRIHIDGNVAGDLRADGLITATPTGSTSYALSLGGPLIDPKVEAFVVVPIAPFNLSARPIVVHAESRIVFELVDEDKSCLLVLDGQHSIEVRHSDRIEFTVSEKKAQFVRLGGSFYSRVEEKLKF